MTRSKSAEEPNAHAIGRSRGGLTTKALALTDLRQAPGAVRLTAGQAGDNPHLVLVLDDCGEACKQDGRTRSRLPAARRQGVSTSEHAYQTAFQRIKNTIPQQSDQIARRMAKDQPAATMPLTSSRFRK